MTRGDVSLAPAEGYLELGLYDDAWAELDKLGPGGGADPDVSILRLDILLGLNRWEDAVALGIGCCRDWQNHDGIFLRTASALAGLEDFGKALELLRNAPEELQQKPEYHYLVARCASRAGRIADAKLALRECFNRDRSYRQRGLDDPDLQPVWNSL